MENLSQEQEESLRKASNERLRVMAGRLGSVSDDEIAVMDRPALMQLIIAGMTARAGGERAVAASATTRSPPRETAPSRELEVQLELKHAELELRRMEAEDRKAERELKLRQMEMDERREEKQRQDRKDQMEFDLRVKELETQSERQRLEHGVQLAQSERGSVAVVGGMSAECRNDVDDSGEPIEPRLVTRPPGPQCWLIQ